MDFSRTGRRRRALLASLALAGLSLATSAWADDTPGFDRPGLGFSTNPLLAGQLGYEQGLPDASRHREDGATSTLASLDSLLRFGLGAGFELQLGSSPWNRLSQRDAGGSQVVHGHGDTSLALKWAPAIASDTWDWGALGSVEFTDGAPGLRSDRRVYTLGTVLDQKLDERTDVSYFLQWQRSGGQTSYLFAPDYNYQINDRFGAYLEAALLRDADHHGGTQAGGGLTWQPTPRLQFDSWFRHRLGGHAPVWEAGLGVAMIFGR